MPHDVAPESVVRFVAELDHQARSVLGDELVSTVLHGSAALGGFVEGRSDVDVLMVAEPAEQETQLGAHRRCLVAERLHAISSSCPGREIELSLVSTAAAANPQPPWPFLLHVATGPGTAKTVLGTDRDGDADLPIHYAVCRAAGIAVVGRSARELIGEIGRVRILGCLRSELEWATEHADPTYGVLNACRAWQFAVTGDLVSKLDGAAWALGARRAAKMPASMAATISSAVAAQTGIGDGPGRSDADELIQAIRSIM